MRFTIGMGGWVEVEETEAGELGLPGRLYVRLARTGETVRITEVYIDGDNEPIAPGAARRLPLAFIEQNAAAGIGSELDAVGPDLSRLATTYGVIIPGDYEGRRCSECSAPLKGDQARAEALGREEALTDWLALSWYSQLPDSGIPQPARVRRPRRAKSKLEEPRLSAPTDGLTDQFLGDVAEAYRRAVKLRQPPAKTLAALAGVDARTVHSWVYKARKRGIMPPAAKRGRIV
jgi:hypothetical protein